MGVLPAEINYRIWACVIVNYIIGHKDLYILKYGRFSHLCYFIQTVSGKSCYGNYNACIKASIMITTSLNVRDDAGILLKSSHCYDISLHTKDPLNSNDIIESLESTSL